MAEAVAPHVVRDLHEVRRHERVERHQGLAPLEPGDLGGEVDLERVAHDRGAVQQCPRVAGERCSLAQHGFVDRDGHLTVPGIVRARRRRPRDPGELDQMERVAAALLVQPAQLAVVGRALEQAGGLDGRQRSGRQAAGAPGVGRAPQLGVQRGAGLAVPVGDREQQS